ncbi:MAG: TolC family protein, partial [Betaproteobacteria bacterium]
QKRQQEAAAQARRVEALREFARLSRLRFDQGVSSYLEVLIAENELFVAELAAVNSSAQRYTQLVGVYQARGGGWVDLAAQRAPQPLASAPK